MGLPSGLVQRSKVADANVQKKTEDAPSAGDAMKGQLRRSEYRRHTRARRITPQSSWQDAPSREVSMNGNPPEPSVFVIFGGTDDRARRKLLPALARIAAVAMDPLADDDAYRALATFPDCPGA